MMKRLISQTPNLFSLLNLLTGSIAIMFSFDKKLEYACVLIIFSALFDVLDGLLARKLNAKSEIGKNLDSFADLVSFGLAPSIFMFHLMKLSYIKNGWFSNLMSPGFTDYLLLGSGFILVLFVAIRLARFNTGKDKKYFTGLPSPAAALLVISLPIIAFTYEKTFFADLILNRYFMVSIAFVLSFLMISRIRFLGFKGFEKNIRQKVFTFILIGFSILTFSYFLIFESGTLFQTEHILKSQLDFSVNFIKICIPGIPLIVFLYIILSGINLLFKNKESL